MNQVGRYREQLVPLVGEQEATQLIGERSTDRMELKYPILVKEILS